MNAFYSNDFIFYISIKSMKKKEENYADMSL